MATKPSAYPSWTTGSSTQVQAPSSGLQNTGWSYLQAPPFQIWNWLHWLAGTWIVWFDYITNPANLQLISSSSATFTYPLRTILFTATATGTLPTASTVSAGVRVTAKNASAAGGSNVVSIALQTSTDSLEASVNGTDTLNAGESRTYECDGVSNWWAV